jgi:hypothetical protein
MVFVSWEFFWAVEYLVEQGILCVAASRTQSNTPHSVGLLWTRDRPDKETSTWHKKTLRTYRHISFRRDKKSQKATGRRPTPWDRATTGIGTIDSGGRKITYPSSGLRDTIFSWTKIDILSSVNPLHASAERRIAKKPRLKSTVISDHERIYKTALNNTPQFFILHKF